MTPRDVVNIPGSVYSAEMLPVLHDRDTVRFSGDVDSIKEREILKWPRGIAVFVVVHDNGLGSHQWESGTFLGFDETQHLAAVVLDRSGRREHRLPHRVRTADEHALMIMAS